MKPKSDFAVEGISNGRTFDMTQNGLLLTASMSLVASIGIIATVLQIVAF